MLMADKTKDTQKVEQRTESSALTAANKPKKSLNDIQIPIWVVLLVVGVLVLGGLVWFLIWGRPQTATVPAGATGGLKYASEVSPQASSVEVLPQTTRNFGGADTKNPFATDVLGDVRVVGTVVNSSGKSTAIVTTQSSSYIVSIGDIMVDSTWEVSKITSNSVVFTSNGTDRTVFVDGIINSTEAK